MAAISATAPSAPAPPPIRSSARGPSEGSVTFCVNAAPTPARTKAQRAATAGEEEATAAPTIPVRAQRAARENVTARPG